MVGTGQSSQVSAERVAPHFYILQQRTHVACIPLSAAHTMLSHARSCRTAKGRPSNCAASDRPTMERHAGHYTATRVGLVFGKPVQPEVVTDYDFFPDVSPCLHHDAH